MGLPSGTDRAVSATAPRLALHQVTKAYGAVTALDAATMDVAAGEVHALLGENGAGKSTLMKIVYGLERPEAGVIRIDGEECVLASPRDAMRRGIGMVQQHFALVGAMTAAENVALGGAARLDLRDTAQRMRRISADAGLPLDPEAMVRDLGVGAQQRLEIIKALARNATTLILDEPTAVLAPREVAELLAWTRRFADGGGTVILIAHKLREVLTIADRVTVLRRGRTVFTAAAREVNEPMLADAMLGASSRREGNVGSTALNIGAAAPSSRPVITLERVVVRDARNVERLRDVSLVVPAGAITGVVAIEGAGHEELLRVMAGRTAPTSGSATVPPDVGFVPEDRHRDAVVLDATLTENVALRGAGARRGRMRWDVLRATTAALLKTRDVRADDADATMRTLSGGNQQKLVLGRELAGTPAALVVENPTRGLDIRATADVHDALRAARDAGTAVVMYSSDLDEVLLLADRVLVVTGGRVREVTGDRETIGRAMLDGDLQ
ncbi:MAG TPA: ATP-binding cassette domain-containing protein [Gemmatimonadaceae bacterium]|nr:ATP-binding cassette domain-containing protein [Gemmatimonadaceae bacterium]